MCGEKKIEAGGEMAGRPRSAGGGIDGGMEGLGASSPLRGGGGNGGAERGSQWDGEGWVPWASRQPRRAGPGGDSISLMFLRQDVH